MHFLQRLKSVIFFTFAVFATWNTVKSFGLRGRQTTSGTCTSSSGKSVGVTCLGRGGTGKSGQIRAQETRFEQLGCACALVGVPCAPLNSVCTGPLGSFTPNIGTGTPKRGLCTCRPGYAQNCTSQTCSGPSSSSTSCVLSVTSTSGTGVTIPACQAAFSTVSGITVKSSGCTLPLQFILAVTASTFDTAPFVDIDSNTLEVYVNNLLPTATTPTQTYTAAAVDANGLISNQISFIVTVQPRNSVTRC